MPKLLIATIFGVLLVSGCAGPQATSDETSRAAVPLVCSGETQCMRYWRRAQAWVLQNSKTRINTANDSIIENMPPMGDQDTVMWMFRIYREPGAQSSERIVIMSKCANRFGCHEHQDRVVASFKQYVLAP